jgi:uncharacterized protein YqgQ
MIENDIQYDSQILSMSRYHKVNQITTITEPLVYFQEILDAIAMIRIEVFPLLKNRTEPNRRHAQVFQVFQLGTDSAQRSALPSVATRLGPAIPAPGFTAYVGPR